MWVVFTGIWALVLSDTDPIEARSNDLRDPRAHFLPNGTSSRVWPVTKPANKTNTWTEAGKLGHRDKNKYKYKYKYKYEGKEKDKNVGNDKQDDLCFTNSSNNSYLDVRKG